MDAEALIAKVKHWARHDNRVVAAAVCGSHARGDAGPDSDVDLCIIGSDPESLLKDRSWVNALGSSARIAAQPEDYGLVQSLRVFYGSLEVELGVTHQAWMDLPLDSGTARVITDGYRILYDPEGHLKKAVALAASMLK